MLHLASASPRRADLLRQLGAPFVLLPDCSVDETPLPAEAPAAYVARLALAKARAGQARLADASAWVLGADTCVVCDGSLLGKAEDRAAARAMLAQLSGRAHQVFTGLCLLQGGRGLQQTVCTEVAFERLPDATLDAYLDSGEWQGKAGSYAIQGFAAAFVSRLTGSYTNVVGLPLFETAQLLRAAGLAYWRE